MAGLGNTRFRDGPWELDVDTTCHRTYFHFFVGIHWVTHGRNFIPMPYPYILRVWIPITHGYKTSSCLAHAHCIRVGYPRVPIPMGKTAIPNLRRFFSGHAPNFLTRCNNTKVFIIVVEDRIFYVRIAGRRRREQTSIHLQCEPTPE